MALLKDIQNVRVAVNGYQHVYNYAQRFVNQGEYGDGFNVGVKFGNKYGSMLYIKQTMNIQMNKMQVKN